MENGVRSLEPWTLHALSTGGSAQAPKERHDPVLVTTT
jgi:hypothetical protein